MDVVGRVKEITESISAEMKSRREKVAEDAKDAIRRLGKCVTDLVDRAERGTLTKVDEDLDGLAADVTRKMGRIALGNEEALRAKKLLAGFNEEVLSIRTANPESSKARLYPSAELIKEIDVLKEENTQLEKDLAFVHKELADLRKHVLLMEHSADTPPAKKPPKAPAKPAAGKPKDPPATKEGEKDDSAKTPEQEAEEQAGGAAKKDEVKK